ncbi:MAG: helix-turn-helix domain-containing protein [Clostridiaceae bacterium]|jgi:DNA-binding XRE family transcriptional regulator|nr:helix-turn-helix domain-containing protein [Clostridiaceae bacterium]
MENKVMLGAFIYELRKEKGLSQTDLGNLTGVSNKAVSKWETEEANPDISVLPRLAQTLGVTVDELLAGERHKPDRAYGTDGYGGSFATNGTGGYGGADHGYETGGYGGAFASNGTGGYGGADRAYGTDGFCNDSDKYSGCRDGASEEISEEDGVLRFFDKLGPREYVSKKRTQKGVPYMHVNFSSLTAEAHGVIAVGFRAKGTIAIGLLARGIIALGLLSVGLLSFGVISVGLLCAFGSFAFGLLSAFGSVAVGFFAFGAITVGVFSFGALAIGYYAYTGVDGLAIGKHITILYGENHMLIPFISQIKFLK